MLLIAKACDELLCDHVVIVVDTSFGVVTAGFSLGFSVMGGNFRRFSGPKIENRLFKQLNHI